MLIFVRVQGWRKFQPPQYDLPDLRGRQEYIEYFEDLSALEDHRSGLVCLWRITLQRPIFKTTLGQPRLPVPKFTYF